ncbi:MAG: SRPBCC family protein [Proteobacteria bacterium]|nr:SRPBCC family protein [Pseudomonadota bacterium]
MTTTRTIDPKLDLMLTREIDISASAAWRGWTEPELIKQWFTPAPWKTVGCKIDLRPGGEFMTVMQSPAGEHFPNSGCYLEVVKDARLTWTSALGPCFRPAPAFPDVPLFTATILFEALSDSRCRYTAIAMHLDEAGAQAHANMGFQQGWGAALEQLVALMKKVQSRPS